MLNPQKSKWCGSVFVMMWEVWFSVTDIATEKGILIFWKSLKVKTLWKLAFSFVYFIEFFHLSLVRGKMKQIVEIPPSRRSKRPELVVRMFSPVMCGSQQRTSAVCGEIMGSPGPSTEPLQCEQSFLVWALTLAGTYRQQQPSEHWGYEDILVTDQTYWTLTSDKVQPIDCIK